MSCARWEERLALLAGGEVSDAEAELHAAGCAECAALLAELRADCASLAATELPWGAAEALHARVMEKVRRRRMGWWWIPAPVTVAALAVVWMMWPEPVVVAPAGPDRSLAVATRKQAGSDRPLAVAARKREPNRDRKGAVPAAGRRAPLSEEFVKLLTDDEDVVILWALDEKGDTR